MPTYNHCPPSSQEYCFNGGECFYLSEDPSVYICSCFMPFYGPQCEHEAPKPGAISTVTQTVPKDDPEGAVRRSVDRAMTITALIFIVVTFLGLLLLAWYLSRRRQKDYAQWKRIRQQSPVESVRARQTMDRGIQVQIAEEPGQNTRPLYHTKRSNYEADMEQELAEVAPAGISDSFDRINEMEAVEDANQTNELERRKRSLEEIFQEIDPVEDPSPTKQSSNRSQTVSPETRDQSIRPDHPQEHSRSNRKQPISDQRPTMQDRIDLVKDEGPGFEEKTIPSRSLYKSGQELTDMQLKSMIEELSEMEQDDEQVDSVSPKVREQPSFEQQPSRSPKPLSVQVQDDTVGVSTASDSTPSTVAVNHPPITVDRATRQALNEQYRLGLKQITTNIQPVEDNTRRYHTLTHVGRASSARPVPELVHTTYVNAIEVQDLVHYTRLAHMHADPCDGSGLYLQSSVPVEELRRGDSLCRTHTLPRPTVSPLWIETHQVDRQPTPIQEPFTVASQHDALLSELYNRGSGDPLITSNPDIV